jgi:putative two-component system response regulator
VNPLLLVVDDEPAAQRLAGRILRGPYALEFASNNSEARALLDRWSFELILCDINMPGESGLQLTQEMATERPDLAVVLVTGVDDPQLAEASFERGAYGYLVKPYRPGDLLITVAGALRRRALEAEARAYRLRLERNLADKMGEATRLEMAHRLGMAVELRDGVTGEHIQRLSRYCELLARALQLETNLVERIGPAALMHDVGKIAIPDRILLKPGPLTPGEREEIQRHPDIGRQMLSGSEAPLLKLAESIAWTHHEKWDGSGYPRGLRDDEIPIGGRIAAVADVYDALTRDRPYRAAMPEDEALEVMLEARGRHFDPEILDVFIHTLPVRQGDNG